MFQTECYSLSYAKSLHLHNVKQQEAKIFQPTGFEGKEDAQFAARKSRWTVDIRVCPLHSTRGDTLGVESPACPTDMLHRRKCVHCLVDHSTRLRTLC
jgi:hypothetical protein